MKTIKDKEKEKKNKYTIQEKQTVLTLLSFNVSKHYIENEFGISRKSIRLWETKKDEIMNNSNKKNFRLPGGGRTSITKNHESEILIWLTTCRRYGIAISCNQIIAAIQLIGKDFKITYNTYQVLDGLVI